MIVVGTAKNAGKTTTFNALRAVARRRGTAIAVTSIGRDGEPADALDAEPKPRVRLAPGTLVALPAGLVPRSPALAILATGGTSALGTIVFARVVLTTTCEIAGPPTAQAVRATIDRLRALSDGPVFVDGAIDRVAALAGGDDAVIVATGAASGATLARVAAAAADAVARLTLPGRDPARERARVIRLDGALDARDAETLLAEAGGRDGRRRRPDPDRGPRCALRQAARDGRFALRAPAAGGGLHHLAGRPRVRAAAARAGRGGGPRDRACPRSTSWRTS